MIFYSNPADINRFRSHTGNYFKKIERESIKVHNNRKDQLFIHKYEEKQI